jgi:hypothetical protein
VVEAEGVVRLAVLPVAAVNEAGRCANHGYGPGYRCCERSAERGV